MDQDEARTYTRNHSKVWSRLDKASYHGCRHCATRGEYTPAAEWAQIHGTDGSNPLTDYMPLCKACHVLYDNGCTINGDGTMTGGYAVVAAELNRRFSPQPLINRQQVYQWDRRGARNMKGELRPGPVKIMDQALATHPTRMFNTEEWVRWYSGGTRGPRRRGWVEHPEVTP